MEYKNVLVEKEDNLAIVWINRPDQLNALNIDTIDELGKAMREIDEDKNIRCVILTGSGEKAFVAGADIKEFYQFDVEKGKMLSRNGHEKLFNLIEQMGTPVIAAINGFALGGGLELAMSCHIRVASHKAKMGLPEVSLGVIPGYGGTQRLAQLAGKGRAMEIILTAQMITSDEAVEYGLVNHTTTQSELLEKCKEIANKISRNSPAAISSAIAAMNAGFSSGKDGFEKEIEEFGKSFGTKDFKEGTTAFVEKRKPNFTGE